MALRRRPPLVVGAHDVPRRVVGVGALQHHVARLGELVPALEGFEIHRAQLPLPDRIVDARHETALLLLLTDLEPDLEQPDAAIDHELLDDRAELEEALVLLGRAEAHDVLDAGPVVPAAVEDHDLAGRREVLDVALHVHLGLLPVRGRGQGEDAKDARAHARGHRLDQPALAGGVAALEDDDDPLAGRLDPVLQMAEFDLELVELLLVLLALQLLVDVFGHGPSLLPGSG